MAPTRLDGCLALADRTCRGARQSHHPLGRTDDGTPTAQLHRPKQQPSNVESRDLDPCEIHRTAQATAKKKRFQQEATGFVVAIWKRSKSHDRPLQRARTTLLSPHGPDPEESAMRGGGARCITRHRSASLFSLASHTPASGPHERCDDRAEVCVRVRLVKMGRWGGCSVGTWLGRSVVGRLSWSRCVLGASDAFFQIRGAANFSRSPGALRCCLTLGRTGCHGTHPMPTPCCSFQPKPPR